MASQSQGIQQLLAAEKKAAEKVVEARKRKVLRIKQAREEAQRDIEKFRQEKEKQFLEYEAKYMGSREHITAKIQKDTDQYLTDMESTLQTVRENVIQDLVDLVFDVNPQLHRNFKILQHFRKI